MSRKVASGDYPRADIREWLAAHPRAASTYTRQRVGESYGHVDRILSGFGDIRFERALDVGCGSGFDTFALARRFRNVTAFDASRRRAGAAWLLARRAGVAGIRVHCARAEDFRSPARFDFVYCNIMSELVSSRRLLASSIARLAADGAAVYYAEETEGYAPMEIAQAIAARDAGEVRTRLHQVINGFGGLPWFRFYLAGSAGQLFEECGFDVVKSSHKTWHGLVYEDAVWLRRRTDAVNRPAPATLERDYAVLTDGFATMRELCRAAVSGRVNLAQADAGGPFSPYLVLLRMAVETLGSAAGKPPSLLERGRRYARRPSQPDWPRLETQMSEFMQRIGA